MLVKASLLWELLSFWVDVNVQRLKIVDPLSLSILKQHWPTTFEGTEQQTVTLSHYNSWCWICLGIPVTRVQLFCVFANHETRKTYSSEIQFHIRNRDQGTCCPYAIVKRQQVEHKLSFVTGYSCFLVRNMYLAFSECSERSSKQSLKLHMISLKTFLVAGGGRNWQLHRLPRNWRFFWLVLFSILPRLLKIITHLGIEGRRKGLLVCSLKIHPNCCYGLQLLVPGYRLTLFSDSKGVIIHIFCFDGKWKDVGPIIETEPMQMWKNLGELNIYFTNSKGKLCVTLQRR